MVMANRYFAAGTERARRVEILFNRVAKRYDRLNDLQSLGLHRLWKRELVRQAVPAPGAWVLDVCCGTGDIALGLNRSRARVVGLDFSASMLAMARARGRIQNSSSPTASRHAGNGFTRPAWLRGDALHLPFATGSFHAVTIGYGLRNLSSFADGLREFHRVTRPGGQLLILDFGKPSNRLLRFLYFGYLRLVVPWFGRLGCGDPDAYSYILESLQHYPAQEGMATLLRQTGWEPDRSRDWLGGAMNLTTARKPNEAVPAAVGDGR
jgi:ubiquinone/menaquinone biosynthesis methyltransferase